MNKGTLPVVARLHSLQASASFGPDGARLIAEGADRNPVAALLREINETMLARQLTFDSAEGPSLTVEVAGRRVLRVAATSGLEGAESCLSATALEDEHKDDLIKLMQAVARRGHNLRVGVAPLGRDSDGLSVGLPVALLADLMLVELNRLPPDPDAEAEATDDADSQPDSDDATAAQGAEMLAGFAEACGPGLIAWLVVDGREDGATGGSEDMVAHLRGFLDDESEALAAQLDKISDEAGAPICVILGATLIDGHDILCARSAGDILLGVIEGDATKTFLPAWIKALAGH